MILIAAVDRSFAIGNKNGLLANIPEDMKFFRETTTGNIIVMGSRTYLSFPKRPLPNRENIILTSTPEQFPEATCFETVGDFLEFAKKADKEIYVCGGAMVYMQLLPYCEKAYITKIDEQFEADAFIPNIDELPGWELIKKGEAISSNGYNITFCTYKNNNVRAMEEPVLEEI